jgi:DNA-binding transcriptional ArsR family regulator
MSRWHPGEILKASSSYWQSCVIHAAVRLDLFSALAGESLSAEEVAKRIMADERGLGQLLDALAAMGLITKRGDVYSNTEASRRLLTGGSPESLTQIIRHHAFLVDGWSKLDQAVRSGTPVRTRTVSASDEQREAFLKGMRNLGRLAAPMVVEAVDLGGRRRLLDLGGGPGSYALHLCKANPGLTATIFDLPESRPVAEETIASFGMEERVSFHGGNFLVDPLPAGFDVAWLSHILHSEGPQQCRQIITKAVGALVPGGKILIQEFILDDSKDGPLFPALFSLNMLVGTEAGRSYSEEELSRMLVEAGASEVRRIPLDSPNDAGIISGTVPA